jgi:hypothetical protein
MCQLVGSVDKPKVMRAMLLKLFLLNHYSKFHDIFPFMAANNRRLPETPIEHYHSSLVSLVPNTNGRPDISDFERVSVLARPVAKARRSVEDLIFAKRKVCTSECTNAEIIYLINFIISS